MHSVEKEVSDTLVISLRIRFLIFAVLFGIIFFAVLGLVGVNLPYSSRYLVFILVIALYVVTIVVLEKHRRKRETPGSETAKR
jgi:membrane protein implicated in regulation of membrane protease activity